MKETSRIALLLVWMILLNYCVFLVNLLLHEVEVSPYQTIKFFNKELDGWIVFEFAITILYIITGLIDTQMIYIICLRIKSLIKED